MKEENLKILRGERQQEAQIKIDEFKASIAEQKAKIRRVEEKVKIWLFFHIRSFDEEIDKMAGQNWSRKDSAPKARARNVKGTWNPCVNYWLR